jgi:hypothetical protein
MRRPRHLLLLCTVLPLLACGDSSGPNPVAVDGTWAGNGSKNGASFSLLITLTETSGGITGQGGISGSGPMCSLSIVGTRTGSKIHMDLTCQGFTPFTFVGTEQSAGRIQGTFSGSGLPDTPLSLKKQ